MAAPILCADEAKKHLSQFDLLTATQDETRQVASHLHKIGCCVRCILRFLGECHQNSYRLTPQDLEKSLLPEECWTTLSDSNTGSCPTCLGILQRYAEKNFFLKIAEKVKKDSFQFDDHQCSLILPVSLAVREKAAFVNLKRTFGSIYNGKEDKIPSVKDVWKWACGPPVSDLLGSKFQNRGSFDILMTFSYANSDSECGFLLDTYPNTFRKRKQRKFGYDTFTRAGVGKALSDMDDSKFADCVTCPPSMPRLECVCTISCCHEPIFIAGRYQKYSRKLSQTPWMINGERIMEGSVQEHICDKILDLFRPTEHRLSSSGREDVDVRMLGLGRPFVVELINPHRTKFTQEEITQLQKNINSSTKDVQVRDLQIVSREDTDALKEGEVEKTKQYTAYCWCEKELTDSILKKLDDLKDLTLQQKTPLRVLHRRTAMVREKVIHNMKAVKLSQHRFKLVLTTQAGTYVKEFVHGDFGRTTPNVSELFDAECDITDLDVESVDVDWPTYIDPKEGGVLNIPSQDIQSSLPSSQTESCSVEEKPGKDSQDCEMIDHISTSHTSPTPCQTNGDKIALNT